MLRCVRCGRCIGMEGRLYIRGMRANCVAFTSCSLFSRTSSHYFPHALIEGGCIGRSTFQEPLLPPSSALKPYRELRRLLSNRIVLRRPLHARLNTPPLLHLTRMQTEKPTPATCPFMSRPELNETPTELLPSALSLNEARRRPRSYRPPSIYTRPDRQRARIAPLRRSPISSFTIFSTLPMASEELFSGLLPG